MKDDAKETGTKAPYMSSWFLEGWTEVQECYQLLVEHKARISCKRGNTGKLVRWTERL